MSVTASKKSKVTNTKVGFVATHLSDVPYAIREHMNLTTKDINTTVKTQSP